MGVGRKLTPTSSGRATGPRLTLAFRRDELVDDYALSPPIVEHRDR